MGGRRTRKDLADEVARDGFDHTHALYAAAQIENPTVERIKAW